MQSSHRGAEPQPDWAVAPGEILAEALEERGMSQSELARRMDRPVRTINEIVNSKAAITPDTSIQLERALGISARLWNGLETQYREHSLSSEQSRNWRLSPTGRRTSQQAIWCDMAHPRGPHEEQDRQGRCSPLLFRR